MAAHSRLGPSAAHRWMTCPGSVRLVDQLKVSDTGSAYAQEGTQAHERAEIEALYAFGQITLKEYRARIRDWKASVPADFHDDMTEHAKSYVDLLKRLVRETPNTHVMIEQRVDTGVPGCWGTSDALLTSPKRVTVVDFKYGLGVKVYAQDNEQLKLYGVGALELVDLIGDTEEVVLYVFQPRLDHIDSMTISAHDLRKWRDEEVAPAAALALSLDGYLKPSEDACRFCPVSGECRARMQHETRLDFGDPDLLDPDEIATALNSLTSIERWCKDVREVALRKIYSEGVEIPGWKVVKSGGRRSITDTAAAIDLLIEHGFDEDTVSVRTTKTLASLEKTVGGAARLQTLLGDLLKKGEGKEALAPDNDERDAETALADARKDFGD